MAQFRTAGHRRPGHPAGKSARIRLRLGLHPGDESVFALRTKISRQKKVFRIIENRLQTHDGRNVLLELDRLLGFEHRLLDASIDFGGDTPVFRDRKPLSGTTLRIHRRRGTDNHTDQKTDCSTSDRHARSPGTTSQSFRKMILDYVSSLLHGDLWFSVGSGQVSEVQPWPNQGVSVGLQRFVAPVVKLERQPPRVLTSSGEVVPYADPGMTDWLRGN